MSTEGGAASERPDAAPSTAALSTFAPADITDHRAIGDWQTRYDPAAWTRIKCEAAYLIAVFLLVAISMFLLWLGSADRALGLSPAMSQTFRKYAFAGLGGTLGGVLFALKWQYHSVAKQIWNYDRLLWRLFTPVISGGLAFASLAVFQAFGNSSVIVSRADRALAFGFLVGMFSDNALAKLTEIALTLFGSTKSSDNRGR